MFTIQITTLTKLNTTILLERYPGEQTTMTTPGPFNTNLETTVGLSSDATECCGTKQLVLSFSGSFILKSFGQGNMLT